MKYLEENDNFEDIIKDGIYLVDFYAQWCGPCKMLSPILEGIEDKINIIKVDIDKFPLLANKYKILYHAADKYHHDLLITYIEVDYEGDALDIIVIDFQKVSKKMFKKMLDNKKILD